MGRPKIEFTEKHLEKARRLASYRVPMKTIAMVLDCCEATLKNRKEVHYAIEQGWAEMDVKCYAALCKRIEDGDMKAIGMYAKWRLEYKEPPRDLHATIDPAALLADLKEAEAATIIPPPPERTEDNDQ
jgi:hypothetical protein